MSRRSPKSARSGPDSPGPARWIAPSPDARRVAEILRYASDPVRLQILVLLAERERDVTTLQAEAGTPTRGTISRHLKLLYLAQLINSRRSGYHTSYDLTGGGRALVRVLEPMLESRGETLRGRLS
jgi:DNA-binding transcriptional ArsR family regulator